MRGSELRNLQIAVAAAFQCDDSSIQRGERAAHGIEPPYLIVGKVTPCSIEHEAHQHFTVDMQRNRHGMVNADASIVIVVKRGAPELSGRNGIGYAVRPTLGMTGVKAHQRMLEEMPVEGGNGVGCQRRLRMTDDVAAARSEIAHRKRGDLGGDEPRQPLHAGTGKPAAITAGLD